MTRANGTGQPVRYDDEFNRAFAQGAELGICDAVGGAEHARVRAAWIEAGRPAEVRSFIADRANEVPW